MVLPFPLYLTTFSESAHDPLLQADRLLDDVQHGDADGDHAVPHLPQQAGQGRQEEEGEREAGGGNPDPGGGHAQHHPTASGGRGQRDGQIHGARGTDDFLYQYNTLLSK